MSVLLNVLKQASTITAITMASSVVGYATSEAASFATDRTYNMYRLFAPKKNAQQQAGEVIKHAPPSP